MRYILITLTVFTIIILNTVQAADMTVYISELTNLNSTLNKDLTRLTIIGSNGSVAYSENLTQDIFMFDSFTIPNLTLDPFMTYSLNITTPAVSTTDTRYQNPTINNVKTANVSNWCECKGLGTLRPYDGYQLSSELITSWYQYLPDNCAMIPKTVSPLNATPAVESIYCRIFTEYYPTFSIRIDKLTHCDTVDLARLCARASYPFDEPTLNLDTQNIMKPGKNSISGSLTISNSPIINANTSLTITTLPSNTVLVKINITTNQSGEFSHIFTIPDYINQTLNISITYLYHSMPYIKSKQVQLAESRHITLHHGWNLINFDIINFTPDGQLYNYTLHDLAQLCGLSQIAWYADGNYTTYIPNLTLNNQPTPLHHGLYVYVQQPSECIAYGIHPSPTTLHLKDGWNLLSPLYTDLSTAYNQNADLLYIAKQVNSQWQIIKNKDPSLTFDSSPTWIYSAKNTIIHTT